MGKGMTRIGMIVPPAAGEVPPEPPILYPDLDFFAAGLGLNRLTPEGYDTVIDRVVGLAHELAGQGADAISLMGTSLSFYRGPEFNNELIAAISTATGLPATTMTSSVIEALHQFGARRIAVATAYGEAVNSRLRNYLEASGYEISALEFLNIENVNDVFSVSDDDLLDLGQCAFDAAPGAEAIFVSCGGLRTISLAVPLEARCGVPVVSSAVAGAWGAARMTGHDGCAAGYGRLVAPDRCANRVIAR